MKNFIIAFIFITVLFSNILYASVSASVSSKTVSIGEYVTLDLTVSGEEVSKPKIYNICGSEILSSGSQTSIQVINGNYQKSYVLSYKFMPKKSCTIESIDVEIDGEVQKTNPIPIKVQAYKQSKNDDFILTFKSDKKEVYVGEPFTLTLFFKQRNDAQALDSKFVAPKFQGFWIKNETKPKRYKNTQYSITEIVYTMAPQRDGNLTVDPAQLQIATRSSARDGWGLWANNVKWRTYFSNKFHIKVNPLPSGIHFVGDFTIVSEVDKTNVTANEAVNVTVTLKGDGNLEDIGSFKPNIDGVSIFDEKINITKNTLTQKIAFVGDKDFTIPKFKLTYFDLQTKTTKTISTQDILVKVKALQNTQLIIKKEEGGLESAPNKEFASFSNISLFYGIIIFISGLIIGYLLSFVRWFKIISKQNKTSLKDQRVLLVKLMPYKDDVDVKKLIDSLEKSLFTEAEVVVDKKLIKQCVSKYNLV